VRYFMDVIRKVSNSGNMDQAFDRFKAVLCDKPATPFPRLPLHVLLNLSLEPGETLRLDSGNAHEPNGRVLLELAPGENDHYRIEFLNLPPEQTQEHHHRHAPNPHPPHLHRRHPDVVAEHMLHYFDAFDRASDVQVLVEDHQVMKSDPEFEGKVTKRAGHIPIRPALVEDSTSLRRDWS
jgi:hypothetical protein